MKQLMSSLPSFRSFFLSNTWQCLFSAAPVCKGLIDTAKWIDDVWATVREICIELSRGQQRSKKNLNDGFVIVMNGPFKRCEMQFFIYCQPMWSSIINARGFEDGFNGSDVSALDSG